MSLNGRRVLVTGAGGFIGSHLCEALVQGGAQVRAFLRYTSRQDLGNLDLVPPEVRDAIEVVRGDLRDAASVRRAVLGCQVVFHLGAVISVPYSFASPVEFAATNALGTLYVLEAARDAGVGRVVHTSTSEVYGTARYVPIDEGHPLQAQSPYAASKIAGDKMAEAFHLAFGLPVVTIRPFNTYGPRQSSRAVVPTILTQLLSRQNPLRLGSLHPRRDLTYVSDTVEGFLRAGECPAAIGQVVQLGIGRSVSVEELVRLSSDLVGWRAPVEVQPGRVRPNQSEVHELLSDNANAMRLLSWEPSVSLEQGLAKTADWIREHLDRYKVDQYMV